MNQLDQWMPKEWDEDTQKANAIRELRANNIINQVMLKEHNFSNAEMKLHIDDFIESLLKGWRDPNDQYIQGLKLLQKDPSLASQIKEKTDLLKMFYEIPHRPKITRIVKAIVARMLDQLVPWHDGIKHLPN